MSAGYDNITLRDVLNIAYPNMSDKLMREALNEYAPYELNFLRRIKRCLKDGMSLSRAICRAWNNLPVNPLYMNDPSFDDFQAQRLNRKNLEETNYFGGNGRKSGLRSVHS